MIRTLRHGHPDLITPIAPKFELSDYVPVLPNHQLKGSEFVSKHPSAEADEAHRSAVTMVILCDEVGLKPEANTGALVGVDACFFVRPMAFRTSTGDAIVLDFPVMDTDIRNPFHFGSLAIEDRGWSCSQIEPALFGLDPERFIARVSTPFESGLDIDDTAKAIANSLAIFNNY